MSATRETWEAVAEFGAADDAPRIVRISGEAALGGGARRNGTVLVPEGDLIYVEKVEPARTPPGLKLDWWFESEEGARLPAGVAIEGMRRVRFCCRVAERGPRRPGPLLVTFRISADRRKTRQIKDAGLGLNRSDRWLLGQIVKPAPAAGAGRAGRR